MLLVSHNQFALDLILLQHPEQLPLVTQEVVQLKLLLLLRLALLRRLLRVVDLERE